MLLVTLNECGLLRIGWYWLAMLSVVAVGPTEQLVALVMWNVRNVLQRLSFVRNGATANSIVGRDLASSLPATARRFAVRVVGSLGLDAFHKHRGGLVVGVLRDQLATEGFGEDGLVELR